jgi:hypothetical protein
LSDRPQGLAVARSPGVGIFLEDSDLVHIFEGIAMLKPLLGIAAVTASLVFAPAQAYVVDLSELGGNPNLAYTWD